MEQNVLQSPHANVIRAPTPLEAMGEALVLLVLDRAQWAARARKAEADANEAFRVAAQEKQTSTELEIRLAETILKLQTAEKELEAASSLRPFRDI